MKTKNEFVKEIWNTLKSIPLEKREAFLYKIKHDWLESVEKRLDKDLSKYWFCKKCKKYFPLKDLKVEKRTEVRNGVLICSDYGYGDDDTLGDCEYLVNFYTCPKCGNKQEIKSQMINVIKEYKRRE